MLGSDLRLQGAEQLVRRVPLACAPLTSLAYCQAGQVRAELRISRCNVALVPWGSAASSASGWVPAATLGSNVSSPSGCGLAAAGSRSG